MPLIEFVGCDACSLKKEWRHLRTPKMAMTTPTIKRDERVLVLGEAPGDSEDLKGTQFVGITGQYLRDRIPTEWKRSLYFQNVIRCHPPRNRDPSLQEMTCCSTYLEKDLLDCRPHAVLGVGLYAVKYFWPTLNKGIQKIRGIPFPIELEDKSTTWFFGTLHPSFVTRGDKREDDGSFYNAIEPIFRNDLINFFNLVTTKFQTPPKVYEPPKEIFYPKTYQEAWNLFLLLKDPYAMDFETFRLRPYKLDAKLLTAAFSDGEITFAIPVEWPGMLNQWGLRFLTAAMKEPKKWIAQSAGMELPWVRWKTGVRFTGFHDTECQARLLHHRTGLGALENLSRIRLGIDIKQLSKLDKDRMIEYPVETVLRYNALDSWSTALIFNMQMQDMCDRPGQYVENYLRMLDTIESTVEMELAGLYPDISQSELMQADLYKQQQDLAKETRALPEVREYERIESAIFSPSAPQDVARVLTSYCGIQLPKNEETDNYYTDKDELDPLRGKHPLVDLTLDYREVAKQLSTYVDGILSGELLGVDGLLHPIYKVCHVKTFRLSSELPNIQNWPKRKNKQIRRQVKAPPGFIIVSCDYGGLEARGIQMACQDTNLKRALIEPQIFLKDIDIHWYWLHRCLDIYPEYLRHLAIASNETEEKKIIKTGRTIIKTDFVFPTFYGSGHRAASARTGIPIPRTQQLEEEFWAMFPVAKNWVDGQFAFYQQYGFIQSLTGRIRNEILPGNEVTNSPIQGTGAEIVLEAQNALYRRAVLENDPFLFPRINIHDDLTFLLPEHPDTCERYIKVIAEEMVKARFPFVTVPLLVEISAGHNWCDQEEIAKFSGGVWGEPERLDQVN